MPLLLCFASILNVAICSNVWQWNAHLYAKTYAKIPGPGIQTVCQAWSVCQVYAKIGATPTKPRLTQ